MNIRPRFARVTPVTRVFKACMLLAAIALPSVSMTPHARAANGSVAYTYDALGRLITASYDTGVCIVYTYDPNGNRTSETINLSAGSGTTGVWGCFVWNAANWGTH